EPHRRRPREAAEGRPRWARRRARQIHPGVGGGAVRRRLPPRVYGSLTVPAMIAAFAFATADFTAAGAFEQKGMSEMLEPSLALKMRSLASLPEFHSLSVLKTICLRLKVVSPRSMPDEIVHFGATEPITQPLPDSFIAWTTPAWAVSRSAQ